MSLSKSRFMAGLQCLKRLYLQVHEPDLAGELDVSDQDINTRDTEPEIASEV